MASDRTQGGPIVVVGGGPAGLTLSYELSNHSVPSLVLERDGQVGGISRTVHHNGYRFDLGGHRFFSKVPLVNEMWVDILGEEFLSRPRMSRIYYDGTFFAYPIRPVNALVGLGPVRAVQVLVSYLWAQLRPRPVETSFEDWVSNRFGRVLFEIFFKSYTEKVWGMSTTELSADWAAQRIQNLSLGTAIKHALIGEAKKGEITKTLIDEFWYPRHGPGQMWEACTELVQRRGSEVRLQSAVERIRWSGNRIDAVVVETGSEAGGDRRTEEIAVGELVASMPIRDLVLALDPAPPESILADARSLRHRDFLVVGLAIDAPDLFPDNWIYIHEPDVQVGRVQNFKNWSPHMVPDPGRTGLGLEYFVWKGEGLWNASNDELIELASREGEQLRLFSASDVLDGHVVRVGNAYPIYDPGYAERLGRVRAWLERLENLQMVGRNGQHRYNNQDHSMMTAWYAARNLLGETHDVWDVNVDAEYHEAYSDDEQAVLAETSSRSSRGPVT